MSDMLLACRDSPKTYPQITQITQILISEAALAPMKSA
jgi:hypothetical protein